MTTVEPASGAAISIDTVLMAPQRIRAWVTAATAATVAGFALGLGYVLDEGIFAPLSDLGAVAFAVTLLPVVRYMRGRFTAADPGPSAATAAVGVSGMVLGAASGALLALLDVIRADPASNSLPILEVQHLGIFLQGLWMAGVGVLGLRQGSFRRKTSLGAVIGGLGYAIGAPVSLWIGFESPLFYAAFITALAGFLTWALSLRNDLIDYEGETS